MDENGVGDSNNADMNNTVENHTTTDALPSIGSRFLPKKKSNATKVRDENRTAGLQSYRMDYPERGYAVIFNNENFHWSTGMNKRTGTNTDLKNLAKLFDKLNFRVETHNDAGVAYTNAAVKRLSEVDHSKFDCFLMVFLSHGDDGVIYGTDGTVKIKNIVDMFRGSTCPSLAGKPKIFIFQACRGSKHEEPVESKDDAVDGHFEDATENEVVVDAAVRPTIPSGSDFLFCYSVAEGFYSHRDTLYGSWYVQAFVEVFEEELIHKGHSSATEMDMYDLLTIVHNKVAMRKVERSKNPESLGKKQMPCFLSMLTKKLFLAPKK